MIHTSFWSAVSSRATEMSASVILDGRSYACLRGGSNAALGLRPEWCEESGYDNGFFRGQELTPPHTALRFPSPLRLLLFTDVLEAHFGSPAGRLAGLPRV